MSEVPLLLTPPLHGSLHVIPEHVSEDRFHLVLRLRFSIRHRSYPKLSTHSVPRGVLRSQDSPCRRTLGRCASLFANDPCTAVPRSLGPPTSLGPPQDRRHWPTVGS